MLIGYSKTQRALRDEQCRLNSFGCAAWDDLVLYSIMEHFKNSNDGIFLTGVDFETYGIAHTKIDFYPIFFILYPLKRYFYTRAFQRKPNGFFNRWLRKKIAKDDVFVNEFVNNNLSNRDLRIFRCLASLPTSCQLSHSRDMVSGQTSVHPASEGPMTDFFVNVQLGWMDILIPKRFEYKYFRENTGKQHFVVFNPLRIMRYGQKVQKEIQGNKSMVRKVSYDGFVFSQVFQDDFYQYVDLDNPSILKYVNDASVESLVKEQYDDAKRGVLIFKELQTIYNLEVFLKGFEEKQ